MGIHKVRQWEMGRVTTLIGFCVKPRLHLSMSASVSLGGLDATLQVFGLDVLGIKFEREPWEYNGELRWAARLAILGLYAELLCWAKG